MRNEQFLMFQSNLHEKLVNTLMRCKSVVEAPQISPTSLSPKICFDLQLSLESRLKEVMEAKVSMLPILQKMYGFNTEKEAHQGMFNYTNGTLERVYEETYRTLSICAANLRASGLLKEGQEFMTSPTLPNNEVVTQAKMHATNYVNLCQFIDNLHYWIGYFSELSSFKETAQDQAPTRSFQV